MNRYLNLRERFGQDLTPETVLGPLPQAELAIPESDRQRLRALAARKHEIACLPLMDERRRLWQDANDLKVGRPPVYVNEICWMEIDDPALKPLCTHPFARELESTLLEELWCFDNQLGDVIVEDYIENPLVVYDSGFGIDEVTDTVATEFNPDIVSRHFHILIQDMNDVDKIQMPRVAVDRERTAQFGALLRDIFSGVINVLDVGSRGLWFTPWDYLIRVMGVEETMVNLMDQPEFVEAVVKRYVDCSMERMRLYNELGVWGSNNTSVRVGSGGYGHISCLDAAAMHPDHCPTSQMWGCGNAQIFSSVSPQMHWQFSLQYEMDWLRQFGVTYYGCCEPLSGKMDIMDKIPNLRKVSMSPWNDYARAAERCKGKYVMSCKPSPAVFATDHFDEDVVRSDLNAIFDATKGCAIELIMKDISTLRFDPQRLIRWAQIAREVIQERF